VQYTQPRVVKYKDPQYVLGIWIYIHLQVFLNCIWKNERPVVLPELSVEGRRFEV
jgi:hypothetical protein